MSRIELTELERFALAKAGAETAPKDKKLNHQQQRMKKMTDIVERLRSDAEDIALLKIVETDKIRQKYRIYGTVVEAADEIERLREALRPFAEIAKLYVNDKDREVTDNVDKWEFCVPFPDLKKAYEALGEKE